MKGTIAAALLMSVSVIACAPMQRSTAPVSVQPTDAAQNTSNLVALFLVKKDHLRNEIRGEVYPIALTLNNRYVEVSTDVTEAVRNDASPDRILEVNSQRTILNAIKDFIVVINDHQLGEFRVQEPIVSQFSCSSVITGQGNFQGQTSLQTAFEQIPQARSSRFSGSVGKKFDETWRTAIAVSQRPTPSEPLVPKPGAPYLRDILSLGKAAIAQSANGINLPDTAVVESMQVVDLDRDGVPEVFGTVKQGSAPQANGLQPTGFASVWVTYQDGKPQALETIQASISRSGSQRSPYNLLETIDLNGDSIDEVIVERVGYESISFEIYEYKNNRLDRVFSGAGYGC